MTGAGLREVENPSELLINQRDSDEAAQRVVLPAPIEGRRPIHF